MNIGSVQLTTFKVFIKTYGSSTGASKFVKKDETHCFIPSTYPDTQ